MKVWIVNPYGTLPSEGWREYRSSMLARALAARGHEVTWFISNFEHRSKSFRAEVNHDALLPGVNICCLRTAPYTKNISLGRIWYERSFGRAFEAQARSMAPPDCIVIAEPSLFFGGAVRKFTREHGITLVVDILDLWPEMFDLALPRVLRPAGRLIFAPFYARRRSLLRQADAVATCTTKYSQIARAATTRPIGTFYLGVNVSELGRNRGAINECSIQPFDGLTCVYAGSLGEAYDMACLADAAELLQREGNVRLIVAGAGPYAQRFSELGAAFPNSIVFLGELPPTALGALYAQAQVGLCTYASGSTVSMPVKLFDYLAAGLAIVTSLAGEIAELVNAGAGTLYPPGDASSLAMALTALAENPGMVNEMRQRATKLGQTYDERHQHEAFAQFIENTVARRTALT